MGGSWFVLCVWLCWCGLGSGLGKGCDREADESENGPRLYSSDMFRHSGPKCMDRGPSLRSKLRVPPSTLGLVVVSVFVFIVFDVMMPLRWWSCCCVCRREECRCDRYGGGCGDCECVVISRGVARVFVAVAHIVVAVILVRWHRVCRYVLCECFCPSSCVSLCFMLLSTLLLTLMK